MSDEGDQGDERAGETERADGNERADGDEGADGDEKGYEDERADGDEKTDDDREIRELDQQTVQRIAAGEVVERPASVVKELVENSLDADASRIDVEVEAGGTEYVKVADDGVGMSTEQVETAVQEHTTSKIRDIDDLEDGIGTLGFRGEALHTIGAVSRTTITTRPRDGGDSATELRLEGGEVTHVGPAGRPPGTTVEVEDLFYNTPARRKYLSSESTEFAHVNRVVTRYALANPDVAVSLTHDGNQVFRTTGQGDLQGALLAVYGREVAESMVEVDESFEEGPVDRVHGYVSDPEVTRSTREYVSTYVNGRYVTDATAREAVLAAYGNQLAPDRFPFAVLFLELPPGDVDVNVHPRKMEVRYGDEEGVRRAVRNAVQDALLEDGLVRSRAPRGRSAPDDAEIAPDAGDGDGDDDGAVGAETADEPGTEADATNVDSAAEEGTAASAPDCPASADPETAQEREDAPEPIDADRAWSPPEQGADSSDAAGRAGGEGSERVRSEGEGGPSASIDVASGTDDPETTEADAESSSTTGADADGDATDGTGVGASAPDTDAAQGGSDAAEVGSDASDDPTDAERAETATESSATAAESDAPAAERDETTQSERGETADRDEGREAADRGRKFRRDAGNARLTEDVPVTDEEREFDALPQMRVLGQFRETYVVAETPDGLVLVDQHAADERVNYERLRERLEERRESQSLVSPVELELTAGEAAVFEEGVDDLREFGFEADLEGRTAVVQAVPAVFADALDPDLLRDVLAEFVGATDADAVSSAADGLLADLACKPAITGNTSLREGDVLDLLERLDDCENPYACPHGRPVVVEFSDDEIDDRFERDYPGHAVRRPEH